MRMKKVMMMEMRKMRKVMVMMRRRRRMGSILGGSPNPASIQSRH